MKASIHLRILIWIPVLAFMASAQNLDEARQALDPERQKEIWDSEHVTFKIEKRFGKWFLDGLRKQDAGVLAAAFHKEFSGKVIPAETSFEKFIKSNVEEVRRTAGEKPANAEDVAAALLDQLRLLDKIEALNLRVLRIATAGEGQWETRLLLTASGRSAEAKLVALESEHVVNFRTKSNSNFDAGAVISSWKVLSETKRSAPQMLMEEVTEASQLHRLP